MQKRCLLLVRSWLADTRMDHQLIKAEKSEFEPFCHVQNAADKGNNREIKGHLHFHSNALSRRCLMELCHLLVLFFHTCFRKCKHCVAIFSTHKNWIHIKSEWKKIHKFPHCSSKTEIHFSFVVLDLVVKINLLSANDFSTQKHCQLNSCQLANDPP